MTEPNRLSDSFAPEQSEARVQRMWRTIDARRGDAAASSRAFGRGPVVMGFGMAALVAVVALVAGTLQLRSPTPLTLAGGAPLPAVWEGPARVALSDGSVLRLAAGSRLELIESAERALGLAVRRGRIRFEVEPHGPRRWSVDCGALQVAVVGTIFTVERAPERVSVAVARGAVVVRGEGVTDRVQRLSAGERVLVRVARPAATHPTTPADVAARLAEAEADDAPPASLVTTGSPSEAHVPRRLSAHAHETTDTNTASETRYRDALLRQDFAAAFDAVGHEGITRRAALSTHVDDLFALADVARLSGHPDVALVPLRHIVERFSADPRAAMAAYTMGQIEAGSLHRPAEAAAHFARSLALGLPRSVRESASYRLVETLGASQSPDVGRAARAYLETYPDGRYRAEVERWRSR